MRMTKRRGAITVAAAAFAAVAVAIPTVVAGSLTAGTNGTAAGASPKAAAVATGSCSNKKMAYAANDVIDSTGTTSTSYVTVPGMSVGFSPTAGCAEITFSAFPFATDTKMLFVRALVNGTVCSGGNAGYYSGGVQFATNHTVGEFADARSYTFVCNFTLTHHNTASVEYRTLAGEQIYVHTPIMVVRYG